MLLGVIYRNRKGEKAKIVKIIKDDNFVIIFSVKKTRNIYFRVAQQAQYVLFYIPFMTKRWFFVGQ